MIRQLIRAAVLEVYRSINRKYALDKGQPGFKSDKGGEKETE